MPTSAKSHRALLDKLTEARTNRVDAREWRAEWADRWVVFADLIAFAARATRSRDVVLNNIVRFDRASRIAREIAPAVRTFRFSDSTYAVAERFEEALAFAVALHHACHAINIVTVFHNKQAPIFHYAIMPRITLARGSVLLCQAEEAIEPHRYAGLDRNNLLAGVGIVEAHNLERVSAGGLLTMHTDCLSELNLLRLRGGARSTSAALQRWRQSVASDRTTALFLRHNILDFPWLLLRPFQRDPREIWCCDNGDFKVSVESFINLWELSLREYYVKANQVPLETTKHADAALRHGIQCLQAVAGQSRSRYYGLSDARQELLNAFRTT